MILVLGILKLGQKMSSSVINMEIASARRAIKKTLQMWPTRLTALVVSSFGRAGSTLVYNAVAEATTKARFGVINKYTLRITMDQIFESPPEILRPGVVYKTHDYPEMLLGRGPVKSVFLFGSAVDAALSVHAQQSVRGEDWVRSHFKHLRRPYRYNEIFHHDVLGFRDQCISWMGFQESPVLCIRYESLWENVDKLSEFCGVSVSLPERRMRAKKDANPKLIEGARRIYGPLDKDMASLPDCFLAHPKYMEMVKLK